MEKFQGPTNHHHHHSFYGENMDGEIRSNCVMNKVSYFRFEEEEDHHQQQQQQNPPPMPFLRLLKCFDSPPHSPFAEPPPAPPSTSLHFLELLSLQQQEEKQRNLWERSYTSSEPHWVQGSTELESCITHENSMDRTHSPVKSETNKHWQKQQQERPNYTVLSSSGCWNGELGEATTSSPEYHCRTREVLSPSPALVLDKNLPSSNSRPKTMNGGGETTTNDDNITGHETSGVGDRKKRKRTRPSKNQAEAESQRMTHIAVERNRRRQMNDHLNALRSLMPSSFIQKGDQASIIGGAIDFVKELEQLLHSLEANKSSRISSSFGEDEGIEEYNKFETNSSFIPFTSFFSSPQYTSYSSSFSPKLEKNEEHNDVHYYDEENPTTTTTATTNNKKWCKCGCVVAADIEVAVVQTHANMKILTPRRPGLLLRVVAALEDLRLTILHLNVTSLQQSVLYSFNLKIEEDCKLESSSADDIATAVHQILNGA